MFATCGAGLKLVTITEVDGTRSLCCVLELQWHYANWNSSYILILDAHLLLILRHQKGVRFDQPFWPVIVKKHLANPPCQSISGLLCNKNLATLVNLLFYSLDYFSNLANTMKFVPFLLSE